MSGLDPEHRRYVLEAVAVWLDALAEAEPPLPGVAPEAVQSVEPVPDLFTMLGQLTALTRETQLQGRATNRLHAELSAKLDHLAENQISTDTMARKLGDIRREARLEVITELLDDLLRRLDVREIPCLGQPFDPTLMQAAEVVHTTTAAPGTVVDVFRPGYISNGRVLRFAEVRVVADARDTPTPQGNAND